MTRTITRHPRTLLLAALAGVLAIAAVLAAVAWAGTGEAEPAGLGTRTIQAGTVEVRMTALALDGTGARFRLVLDTHSVDLGLDLPAAAQLRVNGTLADAGTWKGTGPGGHHREGTLTFTTPIPANATVELRVTGLPTDAVTTWTLP